MTYEQTPKPTSVPEIISAPINAPQDKKPIRILVCGVPEGVNSIVHELHVKRFAEVFEWSPPLPSTVPGEVIRVLTKYYRTDSAI